MRGTLARTLLSLTLFVGAAQLPSGAAAQKVRVSNLSDVDFGLIANLQSESRRSQSICVYSNGSTRAYSVVATGSGAGAAFALSNGAFSLPYAVEWSDRAGATSGAVLSPNVTLAGQESQAGNQFCSAGPTTSASLTVVLRPADLSRARAGDYSGALTLLITPE